MQKVFAAQTFPEKIFSTQINTLIKDIGRGGIKSGKILSVPIQV